jgi:hypothetical protein
MSGRPVSDSAQLPLARIGSDEDGRGTGRENEQKRQLAACQHLKRTDKLHSRGIR